MEKYAGVLAFLFVSFLTSLIRYCKAVRDDSDGYALWHSIIMFVFMTLLVYASIKLAMNWNTLIIQGQ